MCRDQVAKSAEAGAQSARYMRAAHTDECYVNVTAADAANADAKTRQSKGTPREDTDA